VAQFHSEDILAEFAHQLRQPLSTLDALAFYLDLIAKPEDAPVHEQLRLMRSEIARADQVLREGMCTLRGNFQARAAPCSPTFRQPRPQVALCPRSAAEGILPAAR
jgi:hypothetical protein